LRSQRLQHSIAKVVTKASNASETLLPTQTPLAGNSDQNRFSRADGVHRLSDVPGIATDGRGRDRIPL
jgi:hypothetical protein